jgi:bifunctional UDP-N-acetylglucosamine pyrophosphorylase/glucosamine-1-phosphate N-acetyltransferase
VSTDIGYYFGHPERFPLPGLLDGLVHAHELLTRVRDELDGLLAAPDAAVNGGETPGGGVSVHGKCHIGAGTVIYSGVTIIGPVYIGRDCEIMPGVTIRPYSVIGDGCNVGHGSELKRAILFGGAKVASHAFVGDSVLGASARIGSGVITANRRFDQSRVTLRLDGERRDLGGDFFGLVLGDSARVGASCVTQPGTHIGPYTWVMPMTCVRGFIPRGKRVLSTSGFTVEDGEIVELAP